jgi:hypothetical protein
MLWRASDIHGSAIEATDGSIGSVDDFLFSDDDWIVRWAVIDTGNWLPGRQVLLPPNRLLLPDTKSDSISVALTRKQVEDSPEIDRDPPVSRQQEMRIYSHFGWEPYWSSMAASAAMGEPAMLPPVVEPRPMQPLGETGDPSLHATEDVSGYYIHARDGDIGHVEDFLISIPDWVVRYLVVDTKNWWPGKHVLIAPTWASGISWSERAVTIEMTRQQIEKAPEYVSGQIIDRPFEERLFEHHRRPGYWRQY